MLQDNFDDSWLVFKYHVIIELFKIFENSVSDVVLGLTLTTALPVTGGVRSASSTNCIGRKSPAMLINPPRRACWRMHRIWRLAMSSSVKFVDLVASVTPVSGIRRKLHQVNCKLPGSHGEYNPTLDKEGCERWGWESVVIWLRPWNWNSVKTPPMTCPVRV